MGVLLSVTRRNTASVRDLRSLFKPLENKSSANIPPFLSSAFVGLSEAEVSIILYEIRLWTMKHKLLSLKLVQSIQDIHPIEQ